MVEDQPLGFHISTWFVIALFLVEIYNIVLQWICSKIKLDNEIFLLGLSFVIALLGIFFIQQNATGFFKICCRSMYCIFFYRLGCWYKVYGEEKDKLNSTLYFCILLCVQFVFRIVFSNLNIGVYGGVDFDHILVLIITPIVGVFFWLRIAKLLTPLLKDVKWLIYIGKNTMSIMIHHLFAIFLLQAVLCFIHCKTTILSSFDVSKYASSVYYVYAPNPAMKLIYAILSIAIVLLVVYGVERMKKKIKGINQDS